jgi:hypothetical protein
LSGFDFALQTSASQPSRQSATNMLEIIETAVFPVAEPGFKEDAIAFRDRSLACVASQSGFFLYATNVDILAIHVLKNRLPAAQAALLFEFPKLSVNANINAGFASRLETTWKPRAI